ncbi:phosphatase 2C-like domain-containing protein [Gorgonomyces haynaldii]|nr:phosphatase 2C-like domain-containing protein [Gorgonomyces haynaldii]
MQPQKTLLPEDDEDTPVVSWGQMTGANFVSVTDDHSSDDEKPKAKPRQRRSPNRDDSDSDQEIPVEEEIDVNYNPFNDPESIENGFKVGFTEDRNKRYRRSMEDSHIICYSFCDIPGAGFFGIFDGHAGKQAADYCGNNLHIHFAQLMTECPSDPIPKLLNDTFVKTDVLLAEKKLNSGCTAAVAYLRTEDRGQQKRVLYTANAGDARVVLSRDGKAVRLSYDHKGSDQTECRRIMDAGGFVMNNRVNGVLAVTRSLGDQSMKDFVIGNPYTTETELSPTDQFIIIACDGIWDVCTDQQAVDMIKDIPNPQIAADCLLDYALDNCSTDNLSVIVVRLDPSFLQ